jgi:hypothetical protein
VIGKAPDVSDTGVEVVSLGGGGPYGGGVPYDGGFSVHGVVVDVAVVVVFVPGATVLVLVTMVVSELVVDDPGKVVGSVEEMPEV